MGKKHCREENLSFVGVQNGKWAAFLGLLWGRKFFDVQELESKDLNPELQALFTKDTLVHEN